MQEAWEFLSRGGPVMIVIGLCSVAAMAIFFERLWTLQRIRVLPPRFVSLLMTHLREGRLREAAALCESHTSPLAGIAAVALRHAGSDRETVRTAVEERGRREAVMLERFVGGMGSIASVAPLLGLLGTITGMINTFQRVDQTLVQTGQVSPGALASGIWEALITTAAGLAVAIPVYAAYKYILGRVDRFIVELEDLSTEIVDILIPPKGFDHAEANAATARAGDSPRRSKGEKKEKSENNGTSASAADPPDDEEDGGQ